MRIAIEIIGWLAAVLTLAAYGLLSSGRLRGDDPSYQWMNVVGAIGLIANAAWNGALPVAALNLAWALIGIWALIRITRNSASLRHTGPVAIDSDNGRE